MFNPNLRPDTPIGEQHIKDRIWAVQKDFRSPLLTEEKSSLRHRLSKKLVLIVVVVVILLMVVSQQPHVYGLENSTPPRGQLCPGTRGFQPTSVSSC